MKFLCLFLGAGGCHAFGVVPDEGPLTDYETWMPDFMSGLAKGIEKSKGMVTKEIGKLAQSMNLETILPDMQASSSPVAAEASVSAGDSVNVTLNQPVMLDGKVLTTIVSEIQYERGRASLRNLGTR